MKAVLVFAVLLGVVVGYGVIALIIKGLATMAVNRYNRKQAKLNREQENRQ